MKIDRPVSSAGATSSRVVPRSSVRASVTRSSLSPTSDTSNIRRGPSSQAASGLASGDGNGRSSVTRSQNQLQSMSAQDRRVREQAADAFNRERQTKQRSSFDALLAERGGADALFSAQRQRVQARNLRAASARQSDIDAFETMLAQQASDGDESAEDQMNGLHANLHLSSNGFQSAPMTWDGRVQPSDTQRGTEPSQNHASVTGGPHTPCEIPVCVESGGANASDVTQRQVPDTPLHEAAASDSTQRSGFEPPVGEDVRKPFDLTIQTRDFGPMVLKATPQGDGWHVRIRVGNVMHMNWLRHRTTAIARGLSRQLNSAITVEMDAG